MSEPTIAEIDAQIADLQRERDIRSLEGSKAISDALKAGKVATLEDDLTTLMQGLSPQSVACQQTRNVITVVSNTRKLLAAEIARIQAIVDAQAAPE